MILDLVHLPGPNLPEFRRVITNELAKDHIRVLLEDELREGIWAKSPFKVKGLAKLQYYAGVWIQIASNAVLEGAWLDLILPERGRWTRRFLEEVALSAFLLEHPELFEGQGYLYLPQKGFIQASLELSVYGSKPYASLRQLWLKQHYCSRVFIFYLKQPLKESFEKIWSLAGERAFRAGATKEEAFSLYHQMQQNLDRMLREYREAKAKIVEIDCSLGEVELAQKVREATWTIVDFVKANG